MKLRTKIAAATTLLVALSGGAAWAGTSYQSFNMVVPGWRGVMTSASQIKAGTHVPGPVYVSTSGGGYGNYYRMASGLARGEQTKYLYAGDSDSLPNRFEAGDSVKLHARSSNLTPVRVQVTGTWKSK